MTVVLAAGLACLWLWMGVALFVNAIERRRYGETWRAQLAISLLMTAVGMAIIRALGI